MLNICQMRYSDCFTGISLQTQGQNMFYFGQNSVSIDKNYNKTVLMK